MLPAAFLPFRASATTMSATIVYLGSAWQRRRADALRARAGHACHAHTACKIYWAADAFAGAAARAAMPLPARAVWRDPCTAGDLISDSD